MEIYLIRHTRPCLQKGTIYGRLDVELASTFEQELLQIKNRLPSRLDTVFSSPASRCIALARQLRTDYVIDPDIQELNFGLWEGETWDSVNRADSEFWMEDFVNRCPPDGETLSEMNERVLRFWAKLTQLDVGKTAVVTHAGVIRIILSKINDIPLQSMFEIEVGYGEVICLQV